MYYHSLWFAQGPCRCPHVLSQELQNILLSTYSQTPSITTILAMCTLWNTPTFESCSSHRITSHGSLLHYNYPRSFVAFQVIFAPWAILALMWSQAIVARLPTMVFGRYCTNVIRGLIAANNVTDKQTDTDGPIMCSSLAPECQEHLKTGKGESCKINSEKVKKRSRICGPLNHRLRKTAEHCVALLRGLLSHSQRQGYKWGSVRIHCSE
jgi:hypothetical protein